MSDLMIIILIAFVAGAVGTTIGGILGIIKKNPSKAYISAMLAFAAGAMLGMALFEMAPTAADECYGGGLLPLLVGLGLGAAFVFGFDMLFHHRTQSIMTKPHVESSLVPQLNAEETETAINKRKFFKVGLVVFFAIILHDLPEGIAIGVAGHTTAGVWASLAIGIVMLLHNIPEGLSIAVPLRASGMKVKKILLISFLAGVPTVLGAVIGHFIGGASEALLPYILAFAAGAMIYVVFSELLPTAYEYSNKKHLTTLLVIVGAAMIMVFAHLLH